MHRHHTEALDAFALVRDLLLPSRTVFWFDFLLTSGLAWSAFLIACLARPWSSSMIAAGIVAVLALYRALSFIHEIVHLKPGALPGFARGWNTAIGIPFLFPLFLYEGVHLDHHAVATYGTEADPEYLPLAGDKREIAQLLLVSLFLPVLIAVRFLVLSIPGLVFPSVHRWLERHASSLAMNFRYVRNVSPAMRRQMLVSEFSMVILWYALGILAWHQIVPWRFVVVWLCCTAAILLLNTLRALVAHGYRSLGRPMSRDAQIADSIDTPEGLLTPLWAPVGLRFHAVHHLFPTIPYHNLAEAYRRLRAASSGSGTAPKRTVSRGLWHSLAMLWSQGTDSKTADPCRHVL